MVPEGASSASDLRSLSGVNYLGQARIIVAEHKDRVVARLVPPESAAPEIVSREVGVTVQTLEAAARAAWCREHGVYALQMQWRENAVQALAEPEAVRASP